MTKTILTITVEGRPDIEAFRCELESLSVLYGRAGGSAAPVVPGDGCRRACEPAVRGTLSFDLVWEADPGPFLTWVHELDRYRAFADILRACRVRPGAAFAGLMDPARN